MKQRRLGKEKPSNKIELLLPEGGCGRRRVMWRREILL
jgi:hypothetical protein